LFSGWVGRRSKRVGQASCEGGNVKGWPEPYVYTGYDRTFIGFSARNSIYTS